MINDHHSNTQKYIILLGNRQFNYPVNQFLVIFSKITNKHFQKLLWKCKQELCD